MHQDANLLKSVDGYTFNAREWSDNPFDQTNLRVAANVANNKSSLDAHMVATFTNGCRTQLHLLGMRATGTRILQVRSCQEIVE